MDAGLANGQSYTDAAAGVTITVTATSPTSATVSVTLTTPSPCISTTAAYSGMGTVTGGGVHVAGQSATLEATPVAGYNFAYWRENRQYTSYPNPYTFTVTGDRWLEAVFQVVPAAPANDNFASAVTVSSLPSSVTVEVGGATTEASEPTTVDAGCGGSGTLGHTAWYKYTAPTTSTLTLAVTSSTFDTVLAVYTGNSVGGLTRVGCNDNATGGVTASRLTVATTAGTTYYIQLGGLGSAYGYAEIGFSGPADLGVTLTDGLTSVAPGAALSYTVVVTNAGPSAVTSATVSDTLPIMLTGATWTCVATTGSQCGQASGSGDLSTTVNLIPGGQATYTINGTVSPSANGIPGNSVVVGAPGGVTDPVTGNNTATDTTTITTPGPTPTPTPTPTPPPTLSCTPRPTVQVATQPDGAGRLRATFTASTNTGAVQNTLQTIQVGAVSNAVVDAGGQMGLTSGAVITLPAGTTQTTLVVRRTQAGQAATAPLVVVDGCSAWPTFVGGGANSF